MVIQAHVGLKSSKVQIQGTCRLLYVVGQLGLGGLERQLYYLLANLDHARYRPAVVVWNHNHNDTYYKEIEALKIPLYGFPLEWSSWSKLRTLTTLARQVAPEVIHSYGFHTNFAACYSASAIGSLAIGSLRGEYDRYKRGSGVVRGMLNARWPTCHIANSAPSADAAKRARGLFTPRQVFVVRNALDLNLFKSASEASKKKDYVAAVGSLLPVKRWDRLLSVIQRVKTVASNGVHFQIAGDGPLRPTLEKLAGDLGVSENVKFHGALHDISAFLGGAKFLVHTSESEGCPNAVMEAMACGLPVVAMDAGEVPYLVEEGKTGFVVRQGDEATFVERVSLLLGDDERCGRMGLAARAKAEREFKLERLVSETLAVYKAAGWKG
jgi:glycosyltransferase involved in cell wall biosynthesis